MSFTEKYIQSPLGRTALLSALIAAILLFLAAIIPLAQGTENSWYSFLYEDLDTPEEDRFNLLLLIIESLLFTLFYLFLLIFLGSYAELKNTLPSWREVIIAGSVTILLSLIIPRFSVGETQLSGTAGETGYNHFTSSMQNLVVLFTIIGIILMTLYVIYSEPAEKE